MRIHRCSKNCFIANLRETLCSPYLCGKIFLTFTCLAFAFHVSAQNTDSAKVVAAKPSLQVSDSVKRVKHSQHSPAKALLFSAVLPGLGQAYNRKFWKIPIVYVGLGVAAYFVVHNQQEYNTFNTAIKTRFIPGEVDPFVNIYSATELTTLRDAYHRNRDLSFIAGLIVYALNVVDAEVDAQFYTFDVSDNISAHFAPSIITSPIGANFNVEPAISLVMRLK